MPITLRAGCAMGRTTNRNELSIVFPMYPTGSVSGAAPSSVAAVRCVTNMPNGPLGRSNPIASDGARRNSCWAGGMKSSKANATPAAPS
jgi:hypothetical protein